MSAPVSAPVSATASTTTSATAAAAAATFGCLSVPAASGAPFCCAGEDLRSGRF